MSGRPLSPIERMIDEACGYDPLAKQTIDIDRFAQLLADRVLEHIDFAYPKMWEGITTNARRSIRGCIRNSAASLAATYEVK